jgi:DNA-binding PadR family transcriptional regulator
MFSHELKKGSAELLVLSLLEQRQRHGYEIGKLIEQLSQGQITFRIASLYPILCRLEARGFISGKWIEKSGERRRRYFRLTPRGMQFLQSQRSVWDEFVLAVNQIVRPRNA